jgi:hypothetical protein
MPLVDPEPVENPEDRITSPYAGADPILGAGIFG